MQWTRNLAGPPGQIPALDGLRALAILLVMMRHGVAEYPKFTGVESLPSALNLMANGWLGVDLFFVLSGFFIAHHLIRRWPAQGPSFGFLKTYLAKRVLRTFPLYYAVIALILLGAIPLYQHNSSDPIFDLSVHLLFMQDYFGARFLVALWSLATEEKFYLLAPWLVGLLLALQGRPRWQLSLALALCLLPLLGRTWVLLTQNIDSYGEFFWAVRAPFHQALDGFGWGILMALLYQKRPPAPGLAPRALWAFALCAALMVGLLSVTDWLGSARWGWVSLGIAVGSVLFAAMVLSACYLTGPLARLLCSVPLRLISRLSFSLYLAHMLVIPLSLALVPPQTLQGVTGWLGFLALYSLLSTALALALHLVVERPLLRVKDRLRFPPPDAGRSARSGTPAAPAPGHSAGVDPRR
ncbi:acyltransferase family protein [Ferrimonas balearica]|uniref:acyltransferase family protein n=1 Tax=Ferrimonas balearica TaxID=44012 RepID=UPI001C999E36|nr:acyltransferase [Ferrimonas balearica]MBY5991772.1 acyltransferase [Ferrimonas balearica]